MSQPKLFSLTELIQSVSQQLKEAQSSKEKGILQLEKCDLELAVSVKGEGGGGIKFWIVNTEAKVSGETVSKIKLSFKPVGTKIYSVVDKDLDEPHELPE